jgi:hypothetical protein
MERIGIFRSDTSVHGGHAFPGGTIFARGKRPLRLLYDEGAKIAQARVVAKVWL